MGKQSVDAGLRNRWVEDELRLPVLLLDGVGMTNHDGAIWIMVRDLAQAEQTEVNPEGQDRRPQDN